MKSDDDRGQAYILGYIIIIALVISSSAFIFAAVSTSTQSAIDSDQTTVAEWSLTNIDSEIRTPPYADQKRTHSVSTSIKQNIRYNSETSLTVAKYNNSGGLEREYLNTTTRAIQYINPETSTVLTYTLGGLWSTETNESRIQPTFTQRGGSLTVNPVIVTGVTQDAVSPGTIETRNVSYSRIYPQQGESAEVEDGKIQITVSGAGWQNVADSIEAQTEATVTRDRENSTAIATFDTTDGRTQYDLSVNTYTVEIAE